MQLWLSFAHNHFLSLLSYSQFSGDPDLFVSTTHRYPSYANSTWRSHRFGADTLMLTTFEDTSVTPAPPVVCTDCMVYIAVFGSTESTYALTVSVQDTVVSLQDGLTVSARVDYLAWDQYTFHYAHAQEEESERNMKIVLSPMTGNPDVYVTLGK